MLRYHNWLPVKLEPAYRDGYTCDDCGRDFLKGPLFHEPESGVDFCVGCGEKSGLSLFTSLVSTLFFPSSDVLTDSKTHAFVLFAFAFSADTYGYFFSDSVCLMLFRKAGEHIPQRMQLRRVTADTETIATSAVSSRMPWALRDVRENCSAVVELHPLPQRPPPDDLFVVGFQADDEALHITLSDGYTQHFDVKEAIEIVAKGSTSVAAFEGAQPWAGEYSNASETLQRVCNSPLR